MGVVHSVARARTICVQNERHIHHGASESSPHVCAATRTGGCRHGGAGAAHAASHDGFVRGGAGGRTCAPTRSMARAAALHADTRRCARGAVSPRHIQSATVSFVQTRHAPASHERTRERGRPRSDTRGRARAAARARARTVAGGHGAAGCHVAFGTGATAGSRSRADGARTRPMGHAPRAMLSHGTASGRRLNHTSYSYHSSLRVDITPARTRSRRTLE